MIHLGDITKIHGDKIEPVDCITFGSPCQDLSVAGKRAGLAGERSGLFMEAVRIIKEMRLSTDGLYPTFAIWENVPGVFSSNGGEDFRAVLEELACVKQPDASIPRPPRGGRWSKAGAIAGNGWSLAWRQLDAQYWGKTIYDGRTGSVLRMGTPQRRKRIALVADFGGQRAGEILFEREGLPGHFDESVKTREEATGFAGNCPSGNDSMVGEVIPINTQIATRYKSLGECTWLGVGESGDPETRELPRRILFRGKLKSGEWASGNLNVDSKGFCIIRPGKNVVGKYGRVNPETVGQATGILDKRARDIFEGDILKIHHKTPLPVGLAVVKYDKKQGAFRAFPVDRPWYACQIAYPDEIVGNIYDNPDLLKQGEDTQK